MKAFILTLICAGIVFLTSPAEAQSSKLSKLIDATQKDYEEIKKNFRVAYRGDARSWHAYGVASGFKADEVAARISARRAMLAELERTADRDVPASKRGLVRMLIRDLDDINLSLLALIKGDRGYAGYIRTRDEELVKGITDWQEGIRVGIKQTRRCVKLAGQAAGPLFSRATPVPQPAH